MALENYVSLQGPLAETFPQLVISSILHADELTNARRTNQELRNQWFYTADGAVYTVESDDCQECGNQQEKVMLYLTRGKDNPIFKNIDEATQQLINNQNYIPNQEDLEAAVNSKFTLDVNLAELDLEKYDNEFSRFRVNTKKYSSLNPEQRKLAERIYGYDHEFDQNMQMFKDARIEETRIYVLNPDYVKNKIKQKEAPALARAGWLDSFAGDSDFDAYVRSVDISSSRVFGVLRSPQARVENLGTPNGELYRDPGVLSIEAGVKVALDKREPFEYGGDTIYLPFDKNSGVKLVK